MKFFPFTVNPKHRLRELFISNLPKDKTFYEYKAVVRSKKQVEFIVYGIRDRMWGGRGEEEFRFKVTVKPEVTKPWIDTELDRYALKVVQRQEALRLKAEVTAVASGLRGAFNL